ncbi:uncharacterized protein BYT42DRAFT_563383 [Radiomyces spectabilis]|uniref:uncharacterized protein n=1 Tax=Radiomyces spectabilis TaxID=64574 RepID=UPI00221F2BD7|nr:uncharacterized protein BYT42DRAFT_563383 [Radiomyces spectabilis]KAI8384703.1 hypothetical protein BYT42DRAFT_563383 [Radiomyces spectabilis]
MTLATTHSFAWLATGFVLGLICVSFLQPWSSLYCTSLPRRVRHGVRSPSSVMQFGDPGPFDELLVRSAYTAKFDRRDRIPRWVGEHLTAESLKASPEVDRHKANFREDDAVAALFHAHLRDYIGSGYDRGHMAPAADAMMSQEAMDETFLLSNIAPQVGVGFNRHYWAYVEDFCRQLTLNFTDVFVYTGPLFLPQPISTEPQDPYAAGDDDDNHWMSVMTRRKPKTKLKWEMRYEVLGRIPNIAVPTHFFKIILAVSDSGHMVGSFVLPNKAIDHNTALTTFQVELSAIEKASGLQFFDRLDRKQFKNLCDYITCKV